MAVVALKKHQRRERAKGSKSPKRTRATGSPKIVKPHRAEGASLERTVAQTDLQRLVKAHGLQASQLANQIAQAESAMLSMMETTKSPDAALTIVDRLERVRRSAVADLREAARLLEELKYPPVALAAVLGRDQRAFCASGSSRVLSNGAGKPEGS